MLRAERGSKKFNRDELVHAVKRDWEGKLELLKDTPILAVELGDRILGLVAAAKLSNAESWRQSVQR